MAILVKNKVVLSDVDSYVPLAPGEYSKPIPTKYENWYNYGSAYNVDIVTGEPMEQGRLSDISTIADVNGVPTGPPANSGWSYNNYDQLANNRYNHQFTYVVIDLEGTYMLDYAYIWYAETGSTFWQAVIEVSADGTNYEVVGGPDNISYLDGWRKLEIQPRGGVRYIKFKGVYEIQTINGLVFYGRRTDTNLIEGIKSRRFTPHRQLNKTIGTNGFYFEDAELCAPVSESTRFYVEFDWYVGASWQAQGSAVGRSPEEVTMRFETSHMGNIDQALQGFANNDQLVMWVMNHPPATLRPAGLSNYQAYKPVDPDKNPLDLVDTTDPMSYKFMSRMGYYLAARYGSNREADVSMLALEPGEVMKVGMGLIYTIDTGNEWDAFWIGTGWFSPEEAAAYTSAMYDGHMGQMGPGYGIKNADSSMLVSTFAFVNSSNTAYLRDMMFWWDAHRGKGNYPMDLVNIHHYNTDAVNQQGGTGNGWQPEVKHLISICKMWSDFRDRYAPNCEIWLTETGYDEHWGGIISADSSSQFVRSRCKAYWLIRTMLVTKWCGIDVSNQYWFANVGGGRFEDLDQSTPQGNMFASCAYVDGNTEGSSFWGRSPLMSFWYMSHFKAAIKGYSLMHTIVKDGVPGTNETIFNTVDSRVWAMGLKNHNTGESMVIAWLNTGLNFQTLQVAIRVPESNVEVLIIDEAEIRQGDSAESVLMSTTGSGSSRVLNITIGECPVVIKTSNIGTKKPEAVTDVRQQRLDDGNILVTWVDKNIEKYDVQIQRAVGAGSFTTIFQGARDFPDYVDENASPGVTYIYAINLIP